MRETPAWPNFTRLREKHCNYSPSSQVNIICPYNGKCGTSCIVYKATCNETGKSYIGNTQQAYKKRMAAHYSDVRRLVLTGKKSDSFASHFAKFFNTESKPTPSLLWEKTTVHSMARESTLSTKILWYQKLPTMYKRKYPHTKKPTYRIYQLNQP